jgi:ubiquinone biosynthesis protein UbiJ
MPFEPPFAAALNHLLQAEPWARERLIPFSGAAFELRVPLLPTLRLAVTGRGTLAACAAGRTPRRSS